MQDSMLVGDVLIRQVLQDFKRQENEVSMFTLLYYILCSKEYRKAVLNLRGSDADTFLELLLEAQSDFTVLQAARQCHLAAQSATSAYIQSSISRLLVSLALQCERDPRTLLLQEKIELIGKDPVAAGGFADVYKGVLNGNLVAIKRLRAFQLTPKEGIQFRKALLHEALTWHRFKHDHILPFLGIDCDTSSSMFCMVSPWMKNGNINNYLERRGYAAVNADTLLLEIATGLMHLHEQGVVHGDLRGANILVDNEGHALLADFGLTRIADQSRGATSTTSSAKGEGCTKWVAPELHFHSTYGLEFRRTFATDIYAYGCVCIELFTGKEPFPEYSPGSFILEMLRGIKLHRSKMESSVGQTMPDTLWDIICRSCSSWPHERPEAVDLLKLLSSTSINGGKIEEQDSRSSEITASFPDTVVIQPAPGRSELKDTVVLLKEMRNKHLSSDARSAPSGSPHNNHLQAPASAHHSPSPEKPSIDSPPLPTTSPSTQVTPDSLPESLHRPQEPAVSQIDFPEEVLGVSDEPPSSLPTPPPEASSSGPHNTNDSAGGVHSKGHADNTPDSTQGIVIANAVSVPVPDTTSQDTMSPSPPHFSDLHMLAEMLLDRHIRLGADEDLQEAIKLYEQVLEARAPPHPDRWRSLMSLSVPVSKLYRKTRDVGLLERLVDLDREAYSLRQQPGAEKMRHLLLDNLALGLSKRYYHLWQPEDLDEAIELWEEAIEIHTASDQKRLDLIKNLSSHLRQRCTKRGSVDDLDRAVELQRQAVELAERIHSNKSP